MAQMYKVFYNKQTIIFKPETDIYHTESEKIIIVKPEKTGFPAQLRAEMDPLQSSVIIVADPDFEGYKRRFLADYYPVHAAGGVVYDTMDRILAIRRRGLWDLPKGKQDADESPEACAVRETTEETGVGNLLIVSDPFITSHIYCENNRWLIKHTSWFLMHASCPGTPVPQTSEDISEAKWGDLHFIKSELMPDTYPLIRDVLNHFLQYVG